MANYHYKNLMLLSCASSTANWNRAVDATCAWIVDVTCAWIWQFSLGDICCTDKIIISWCHAAMLERESRRDSYWRQPWISDSLTLGLEIKIRNHPIGCVTDIFPCSNCFIAGLSKWTHLLQVFLSPLGPSLERSPRL